MIVVVPYQALNSVHEDTLNISRVSNNSKLSNNIKINMEADSVVPNFADVYKSFPF